MCICICWVSIIVICIDEHRVWCTTLRYHSCGTWYGTIPYYGTIIAPTCLSISCQQCKDQSDRWFEFVTPSSLSFSMATLLYKNPYSRVEEAYQIQNTIGDGVEEGGWWPERLGCFSVVHKMNENVGSDVPHQKMCVPYSTTKHIFRWYNCVKPFHF